MSLPDSWKEPFTPCFFSCHYSRELSCEVDWFICSFAHSFDTHLLNFCMVLCIWDQWTQNAECNVASAYQRMWGSSLNLLWKLLMRTSWVLFSMVIILIWNVEVLAIRLLYRVNIASQSLLTLKRLACEVGPWLSSGILVVRVLPVSCRWWGSLCHDVCFPSAALWEPGILACICLHDQSLVRTPSLSPSSANLGRSSVHLCCVFIPIAWGNSMLCVKRVCVCVGSRLFLSA
jgi:hypothetical protein